MDKIGRNDPCPCGSSKKYKKCCALKAATGYDQAGRQRALSWLKDLTADTLGRQDDIAFYDFWGHWLDESDELPEEIEEIAEAAFDMWMFFDRPLEDGQLVVDRVLDEPDGLDRSTRAYLTALRATAMHLWEIVDLVPGASLTLRDVLENSTVTVRECTASRTLSRHEWIVARVVPCGASGAPEIERGMLHIPELIHDVLRAQLTERRAEALREHGPSQLAAFYKGLPPFFHDVWVGSILEPMIPELHNSDGERILMTRVTYEVLDVDPLVRALDTAGQLEREPGGEPTYHWTGTNREGASTSLGRFDLKDGRLAIEVSSRERAERARALLESIARPLVKHRSTTHEDMTRLVRDAVRERALTGRPPGEDGPAEAQVPKRSLSRSS